MRDLSKRVCSAYGRTCTQLTLVDSKYCALHYERLNKRGYSARTLTKEERARLRGLMLLKKYGLTQAAYEAILATQGGRCAICRSDKPLAKRGWSVDHCHATGTVRGILCSLCNTMLAHARDNPETLRAGIAYLERAVPLITPQESASATG